MKGMENNKIFAAVLVAGIVAMLSGFIANKVVAPEYPEQNAVTIDVSSTGSGSSGPAKPAGPDPILALIATADIAKGEKLSKACAACHSFDQGGPHKVGPNIYDIVGAPKAGKAGFSYSTAMAEKSGAWGYDELNNFLWKPKKYLPGTKMNYNGLKKPNDRAALIAWLRTQASSQAALPSAAEIEAEISKLAPPVEEAVEAVVEDAAQALEEVVDPAAR